MAQLAEKEHQAIEAAILAGRKIDAIKLYREAVPEAGLADAKEWVERLEAELRAKHPEEDALRPKKSGCLGLLAALATLSAVVWVLMAALGR
jgi:ribosomal protein L7/L12